MCACKLTCVSLWVSVGPLGSVLGRWSVSVQAQNWRVRALQPVWEAVWQPHLADSQAGSLYF